MLEATQELERQLVGSLLMRPENLDAAFASGLSTKHVAARDASAALGAILSLDLDGAPVTVATVANAAQVPPDRLREWMADGTPASVGFLAREVVAAHHRREFVQSVRKVAAMAELRRPEDVAPKLAELADRGTSGTGSRPLSDFTRKARALIDPTQRDRHVYRTGFPKLDRALGGGISMTDEQMIIAADTGAGKTTFMLNVAASIAGTYGIAPLVVSLEMGGESIAAKILGMLSGVPIRKPRYSTDENAAFDRAVSIADGLGLRIMDETPTQTTLEAKIREHVRECGSTPVFIDYLQLVPSSERNSVDRIAEVSKTLRRIGRNVGVPIIALAQLNREGAKARKMPTMHDLKGSGQIEQDATTILMLWRPDPETGEVRARIDKQRFSVDGTAAQLTYEWHESGQAFEER